MFNVALAVVIVKEAMSAAWTSSRTTQGIQFQAVVLVMAGNWCWSGRSKLWCDSEAKGWSSSVDGGWGGDVGNKAVVVSCKRALAVGLGQMVVLAQLHDKDETRRHDSV